MSEFTFLGTYWSDSTHLGALAEKYVVLGLNMSMIKQEIINQCKKGSLEYMWEVN